MNEEMIQEALMVLSPDLREAIVLSRFHGLTYAEIAQISGCSEGAIKTRVFRSLELLKQALVGDTRGGDQCLNVV